MVFMNTLYRSVMWKFSVRMGLMSQAQRLMLVMCMEMSLLNFIQVSWIRIEMITGTEEETVGLWVFLRGLNRNIKMNECNTEASVWYDIQSLKEQLATYQMFFSVGPGAHLIWLSLRDQSQWGGLSEEILTKN